MRAMTRGLDEYAIEVQKRFGDFLAGIPAAARVAILCHSDVDGLTAGALLTRALARLGFQPEVHATAKGENAWSPPSIEWCRRAGARALFVCDLGSRPQVIVPDLPTLLIDHHRPFGVPPAAVLISGYGWDPTPTTGLLAYWCCNFVHPVEDLDWMAALSILADNAESAGFAELSAAKRRYGAAGLRKAASLLNAARRSSSGDAAPALALLLRASSPKDITSSSSAEAEQLKRAQLEVQHELQRARKSPPRFSGQIALIRIHSPCQIHPLIAQMWRQRFTKYIVMCANTGFRPGFVHFSARCGPDVNLLDFLARVAPHDTDEGYGSGHNQASGGALTYDAWNEFVQRLGFGVEMLVRAA